MTSFYIVVARWLNGESHGLSQVDPGQQLEAMTEMGIVGGLTPLHVVVMRLGCLGDEW